MFCRRYCNASSPEIQTRRRSNSDSTKDTSATSRICLRYHKTPIETVYIGIGSNIDAERNLQQAAVMLRKTFPDIRFSPIYDSAPLGFKDQDSFLNATAVFVTKLSPESVATKLRAIEKKLKKNPPHKFGPRTIDLDLLLYGNEILLDDALTIPHLALHERLFVLRPLIDLGAGDVVHPGFDIKLKTFAAKIKGQKCRKTRLKAL